MGGVTSVRAARVIAGDNALKGVRHSQVGTRLAIAGQLHSSRWRQARGARTDMALAHVSQQCPDRLVLVEGCRAAQHHIQRNTHRPQVDTLVVARRRGAALFAKVPRRYLRRGVQWSAAKPGESAFCQESSRAQVDDLELLAPTIGEADVLRLEVAVDDACLVHGVYGINHLRE